MVLMMGLSSVLPVAAGQIQVVSAIDNSQVPPAGGGGDSWTPIISADGRYVLFASSANNLVLRTNGNPIPALVLPKMNAYLRDRTNGTTTLVSVNLSGAGGGNGDSFPSEVSTNGRYVLFESSASDLVAGDTNGVTDIFLRDLVAGTTTLVTTNSNGGVANDASHSAVMTPDARYVGFVSAATNLVAGDTNRIADVFVRDLLLGTTVLVSAGAVTTNTIAPVGSSEAPDITPDGRFVAFSSTATNLVPGVNTTGEIYVRDLVAGTTIWASTDSRSRFGSSNVLSYNHVISSDGAYVAFMTSSNPPSAGTPRGVVLRYNVGGGSTDLVNSNANVATATFEEMRSLAMTPDGRFIAFAGNTNGASGTTTCILLWDGQTGSTTLVSGDQNGRVPTNSICDWPVIDSTGRYVAFLSSATNLVTNSLSGDYHLFVRDTVGGTTTLVAADTNGAGPALSPATVPAMSADGRFVAFESPDSSLVSNDRNRDYDVFVRDLTTDLPELVSSHDPLLPSMTPNGPSSFTLGSISGDGRFVAFASEANNLVANDTNGNRDVFVRDRAAGTNILVSVATNGVAGDGISTEPSVSASGRYVVFTSSADNLIAGDTNKALDVFVRDLQAGVTILASVDSSGLRPGNKASYSPVMSGDGRFVMFRSAATNLALGTFSGAENLFVRDLQNSNTYALTTAGVVSSVMTPNGRLVAFTDTPGVPAGKTYLWDSLAAARIFTNSTSPGVQALGISADGNRIVCWAASNPPSLYATDRSAGSNWTITAGFPSSRPGLQFSRDGNLLVYSARPISTGTNQVYVYDFVAGASNLISKSFITGSVASSNSDSPVISADGRFIAYHSSALDLAAGDTNSVPDTFLYDRATGANTLLSASRLGTYAADNRSLTPVFSSDGRTLMFESWGSDVSAGDFNHWADLFSFTLFYADIATSIAPGIGTTISWPASSGTNFTVEYKETVDGNRWRTLPGPVIIIGDRASMTDTAPSAIERYYRVVGH
jgi:Tol biopolymer transport system component